MSCHPIPRIILRVYYSKLTFPQINRTSSYVGKLVRPCLYICTYITYTLFIHHRVRSCKAQNVNTQSLRRTTPGHVVTGDPQFSVQTRPAARAAVHVPGKVRLGAVLLQGGAPGAQLAHAQEPTGLHRHEPDRSQHGAVHFICSKTHSRQFPDPVRNHIVPSRYRNRFAATSITSCRKPCAWAPAWSSVRCAWTREPMCPARRSRSRPLSPTTAKLPSNRPEQR